MDLLWNYTEDGAKKVGELENLVDQYEDELGTYLVKLSRQNLSVREDVYKRQVCRLWVMGWQKYPVESWRGFWKI